jgi:hypothetical protein
MAHDVIHERFPSHGSAYYQERNRRARHALQEKRTKQPPETTSAEYFSLVDDLAVGEARLGRHEEAVRLMRAKLAEQQALGQEGRNLYSSYANLGTFLILWQLSEGFADAPKARERIRESVALIHTAIKLNPQSHFGREIWQAVIEEYLLELLDNPDLVLQYDMVGNRLDEPINPAAKPQLLEWDNSHYRISGDYRVRVVPFLQDPYHACLAKELRGSITKVGAENGWPEAVRTSHKEPVPFDEPVLGIIGMWRLGAGANPHFALALGETMLRVGQRHIAWCAYERAAQMSRAVGQDPTPQKFVEHCRRRQKGIQYSLPPNEVAKLRPRFDAELEHGRNYQQAYQAYEAERIREGASVDDAHFYHAFDAEHGPIASPIGSADKYFSAGEPSPTQFPWAAMLLFAGLFAVVTSLVMPGRVRRQKTPAPANEPSGLP